MHDPGRLAALCAALCQCFAFETSSAALLLFAVPEGSAYLPPARKALGPDRTLVGDPNIAAPAAEAGTMHGAPAAQEPEARGVHSAAKMSEAAPDTKPSQAGQDAVPAHEPESASGQPAAQVAPSQAEPALAQGATSEAPPAVLLPRMPMGLALAADPRTYQALAGVARGMGRMAGAAGARHSPVLVPGVYYWCSERSDVCVLQHEDRCRSSRIRVFSISKSDTYQSLKHGMLCQLAYHTILASLLYCKCNFFVQAARRCARWWMGCCARCRLRRLCLPQAATLDKPLILPPTGSCPRRPLWQSRPRCCSARRRHGARRMRVLRV